MWTTSLSPENPWKMLLQGQPKRALQLTVQAVRLGLQPVDCHTTATGTATAWHQDSAGKLADTTGRSGSLQWCLKECQATHWQIGQHCPPV